MTKVKKGGCEYTVDDAVVDEYLSKGYSIIDARGNTIRTGSPTTYNALIVENAELRQATKRLEQSNVALAAQVAETEQQNTTLKENAAVLEVENQTLKSEIEKLKKKQPKTEPMEPKMEPTE